ncbi:FGGY-family carbohydrate kinase [Angustibacter aerolatus]
MTAAHEVVLGIDLGTASSKGVLTTPDGAVVATAVREHGMSMPSPGWYEVDAEQVWWGDVVALCRELLPQAGGARVAGACVSGVGPALVLLDAGLRPVRPAILYGIDTRAGAEVDELTERYGADAVLERCGSVLSSQALGPKIRWVQRHEPDVFARARHWHGASSYVVALLSGGHVQDHETASQCDPMYDVREQRWSPWAAEVAGHLPLPPLVWPTEVVGEVHENASAATGLPVGTPVVAGTIDAWAEAASVGVRRPGDLMLMYGSTTFLLQVLDRHVVHPRLWATSGVDEGVRTLAGGMATSGSLTQWVQQLAGGVPFEQLVREAGATPPGADGLLLLPYFAGERTPVLDPLARGVLAGMTLRHTRGHVFRAVYEGIAHGTRHALELLDEAAGPASRVVAVGGGTQGGFWTQVVSDVTGREQLVPEQTIGACYGDALMAATGVGLVPPGTDWTRVVRTVVPEPAHRELYDAMHATYQELYPATLQQVHALARLQSAT